jgi:hypothetical protein
MEYPKAAISRFLQAYIAWWWTQDTSAVDLDAYLQQHPDALKELDTFLIPKRDAMPEDIEAMIKRHAAIVAIGNEESFVGAAKYGYDLHQEVRKDLQEQRNRFEELAGKFSNDAEASEKIIESLKKKIKKYEQAEKTNSGKKGAATGQAENGMATPAAEENGAAKEEGATLFNGVPAASIPAHKDDASGPGGDRPAGAQ